MYKVGIVGFGKMGMLHGALLCGTRKAQITAICDRSAVMRIGFKKMYKGVHTYKDANDMFAKEKLDIVIVATPTFNHRDSVLKALENGAAVFVEKPLAVNMSQANEICQAASRSGKPVQVGFCNRFAPAIAKGKEILAQGEIGEPETVNAWMYIGDVFEQHTGWRYKKSASGGGALMDFGIHMVDLLIWYFGKIDTVGATSKKLYSIEVEDEVNADFIFKSGIKGHFETSWSKEEYRKSYSKMRITCTKGSMEVTDQTIDIFDVDGNRIKEYTYPDLYDGCFMDVGGILYSKQIEAFLNAVEGGPSKGCTSQEGAYVMHVIESMYSSAETGNTLNV